MTKVESSKNCKIKVMHVLSKLDTGGLENGVINLCNNLDRARFEPMICCLNGSGSMAQRLKADVRLFDMNFPDERNLFYPFKLAGFFRKEKPHIVHTHGWGQCSLYAITGARLGGIPAVINGEHGAIFTRRRQVFLQRIVASLSNTVLSVSESLKTRVARELAISPRKFKVINNGVDTLIFSGDYDVRKLKEELKERFDLNISLGGLVIGSVGSLKPQKNQIMLLEAIRALNIESPNNNVKVILVGDGPDRSMLEAYIAGNKMKKQVVILGKRSDIPELLSLFDVFISTSLSEGLSNVILEALSSSVPVIATKSVGTPELVYDGINGFIVHPPHASGFAEKIKFLLENRHFLKELSANARKFIEENYSIKKMVSSYEDFYSDCLDQTD